MRRSFGLLLLAGTLATLHGADRFLFASFRGNGEDGVHYALSADGYKWTAAGGDRSYLKPEFPGELMRDPFLTKAPDGIYHLLWTWGWYRDAKGLRIGHATSKDLLHWSAQETVPVFPDEPAARNAWAPEMSWDGKTKQWILYWATTIPGRFAATDAEGDNGLNHRIYSMTTKDFRTFSAPKIFFDPGFSSIDTTVLPLDGEFVMFVKDERKNPLKKNLRMAFAKEVAGPYGGLTEAITGSWEEGPTALRIGGETFLYFDHYQNPQHYRAMKSADLKKWEDITERCVFPAGLRHGTAIPITEAEAAALERAQ
jgi:hypothetical protein